jgi:hypothetical protein
MPPSAIPPGASAPARTGDRIMSDETFNMSLRKFLKTVGVTSQQKLEEAVRAARAAGTLPDGDLSARIVLTVDGLDLTHVIEGKIATAVDDAK